MLFRKEMQMLFVSDRVAVTIPVISQWEVFNPFNDLWQRKKITEGNFMNICMYTTKV